ncbi:hypothetical protein QR685DRAFT_441584 [Neurospora intermedia]|uniref:Uncharacterized protein n=1 Tax=Neurospora intermedia TaxID=5142 RepID=A0ABR3DBQ5_NEUIN
MDHQHKKWKHRHMVGSLIRTKEHGKKPSANTQLHYLLFHYCTTHISFMAFMLRGIGSTDEHEFRAYPH